MNKSVAMPPCLIFSNYTLNEREGGPSGFLGQNLKGNYSPLYRLGGDGPTVSPCGFRNKIYARLFGSEEHTQKILRLPKNSSFVPWLRQARLRFLAESADEYRFLWFHDVWSLFACIDLIKEGQRIIFQPHTPELPSQEVKGNNQEKSDVEWTEMVERIAFQKANIVVLPNKHVVPIFNSLLSNDQQIHFLSSGAKVESPRFQVPLEEGCVFYLFIGRRNEIKGFTTLLSAFQLAYAIDSRLRLLLIGKGDKITIPGVIDIGFTTEVASWMASCDYLVSTNKQSYFDLTIMEALGTGTPIIYFPTGGHAELNSSESAGLVRVSEPNEAGLVKSMTSNTVKRYKNYLGADSNIELYNEKYTDIKYRERLLLFLEEVVSS